MRSLHRVGDNTDGWSAGARRPQPTAPPPPPDDVHHYRHLPAAMSASALDTTPQERSVLPPLTPARFDPTHAFARAPASILRRAGRKSNDTVGSSVRFGKRQYDNGEESSMSITSASNISIDAHLASPSVRTADVQEDSFLRPGRRVSALPTSDVLTCEDDGSMLLEGSIEGSVERALTPAARRLQTKRELLRPPSGSDDSSLSFNTLLREGAALQSGYAAEQWGEQSGSSPRAPASAPAPAPNLLASGTEMLPPTLAQRARTSHPEHDPYSPFNADESSLFSSSLAPASWRTAPAATTPAAHDLDPSQMPLPDSSGSFSQQSLASPARSHTTPANADAGTGLDTGAGTGAGAGACAGAGEGSSISNTTLHPHEASPAAHGHLPTSPVPRVTVSGPSDSVVSVSEANGTVARVPFASSPLHTPLAAGRQAPAPLTPSSFVSASAMYSTSSSGYTSASGLYPSSLRSTARSGDASSTRWSDALDAEALHEVLDAARDLDRAQTARAERYEAQLALAHSSVGALQTSLLRTEQDAEEERDALRHRAEAAEQELADLSRQAKVYDELSSHLKRLTLSVREAQEGHLAEKARFQAQLQAEVQRGDELAAALASAERDAEVRIQKAREDALHQAKEDTRSLLEAQVRAAEERTRQACERDWAVRPPAPGKAQHPVEADLEADAEAAAERDQLQVELEEERRAREDLQSQCDEMEARLQEGSTFRAEADAEQQIMKLQAALEQVDAEHEEERRQLLDEQRESEAVYHSDLCRAEQERDEKAALLVHEQAVSRQQQEDLESVQRELERVQSEQQRFKWDLLAAQDALQDALREPRVTPEIESQLARLEGLKRHSANQELECVRLQKHCAKLESEHFKLVIALQAKQSEVTQLKRTQGVRWQFVPGTGQSPAGLTTIRRMFQQDEHEVESEAEPSRQDVDLPEPPRERVLKHVGLPRSMPTASTFDKENLETPMPKAGKRRLLRHAAR